MLRFKDNKDTYVSLNKKKCVYVCACLLLLLLFI